MSARSFTDLYPELKTLPKEDLQMVLLFCHLLLFAKKKKLSNYMVPAKAMGAFSAGLGPFLERMFEANVKAGDPLYGALIVNKDSKMPSEGFFNAAIRFGLVKSFESEGEKVDFWVTQRNAAFSEGPGSLEDFVSNLSEIEKSRLRRLLVEDKSRSKLTSTTQLYFLDVLNPQSPNWKTSDYRGSVLVEAEDERQARFHVFTRFLRLPRTEDEANLKSPWLAEDDTSCEPAALAPASRLKSAPMLSEIRMN